MYSNYDSDASMHLAMISNNPWRMQLELVVIANPTKTKNRIVYLVTTWLFYFNKTNGIKWLMLKLILTIEINNTF